MSKILYIGEDTASYHLFFNGVSSLNALSLFNLTDFKQSTLADQDINKILESDHIIFSRDIDWKTLKIASLIIKKNIPYSYYADDNYFILKRIIPSKKVNQFLFGADAFISTTSAMNDFFESIGSITQKKIQLEIDVHVPKKPLPRRKISNRILNIGFLGTGKNWLYKDVLNDLSENLSDFELNIFAPSSLCQLLRKNSIAKSIKIIEFNFIKNYPEFIDTIKEFNLDFILQPADLTDQNYQFKNLNTLLLPYQCNCLTIFCESPPYNSIKRDGLGELLIKRNKFSERIAELVNDNEKRIEITERLFTFVENNFSANNNIGHLQEFLNFKENSDLSFHEFKNLRFRKIEKIYHKYKRSLYRKFTAS